MESSMDETGAMQSFQSPPRRRRSTFFERRDSVGPQPTSEHTEIDVEKNLSHEGLHEMSRYYDKLLSEKEQWKKEVTERRHKYHELRKQYQVATQTQTSSANMSYAALTNEDIEFLKGKPNLSKLVDSQQKLHKSVKETAALVRRANELEDVALNICKDRINKITEYILENSTVE